jgi:hypothetical protein
MVRKYDHIYSALKHPVDLDCQPGPSYMVDNQHNYFKTAPDKGECSGSLTIQFNAKVVVSGNQKGPVWSYSGSLERYMSNLKNSTVVRGGSSKWNGTRPTRFTRGSNATLRAAANGYWLTKLGPLGAVSKKANVGNWSTDLYSNHWLGTATSFIAT